MKEQLVPKPNRIGSKVKHFVVLLQLNKVSNNRITTTGPIHISTIYCQYKLSLQVLPNRVDLCCGSSVCVEKVNNIWQLQGNKTINLLGKAGCKAKASAKSNKLKYLGYLNDDNNNHTFYFYSTYSDTLHIKESTEAQNKTKKH